jgi:hypothetical protein
LSAEPHWPFIRAIEDEVEHDAEVPLPVPAQVQLHGLLPLNADAVPALHRPVVGALVALDPSDGPHTPLVPVGAVVLLLAEQNAGLPPFDPAQLQSHGPLPVTPEAVPALHRPVVGALLTVVPLDGPHCPFTTTSSGAEHDALAPPFDPAQVQFHGPLPLRAEAAPVEQRLIVGALPVATPFAAPQAPFTSGRVLFAEHEAVVPLFAPAQVQFQGPLPLSTEAVPVLHRPVVGGLATLVPFAAPHCPFTGTSTGAEHDALAPPFDPAELQLHGPLPLSAEAVPVEQRLVVGALPVATPLAAPQTPLMAGDTLPHTTKVPLALHSHSHTFIPMEVGVLGVPGLQRPVVGALVNLLPLAVPHWAFGLDVKQEAVLPPLDPMQFQLHGPAPVMAEGVPALQRPVDGALVAVAPLAGPHTPLVPAGGGVLLAEQIALLPPLVPAQIQPQGPVPLMAEAVPVEHRPVVGAVATVVPFAGPHTPLVATAAGVVFAAEHEALLPPFAPAQVQPQGPVPLSTEAVPVEHRPVIGAVATVVPLAGPHMPFTATGGDVVLAAEHEALLPPFDPAQVQLHGPVPLSTEAVPVEQRPVVGALATVVPFAAPHTPLVATGAGVVLAAEHEALLPPFAPAQVQFQGPLPLKAEAVPVEQKPVVGAVATVVPFAGPHTPLVATGAGVVFAAEHEALPPPFDPAQVQCQGPVPLRAEAVPAEQRPVVGAVTTVVPLAAPQTPLTGGRGTSDKGAWQKALRPPLMPAQLQFHGPPPLTREAVPVLQSPAAGAVVTGVASAGPHAPLAGGAGATVNRSCARP